MERNEDKMIRQDAEAAQTSISDEVLSLKADLEKGGTHNWNEFLASLEAAAPKDEEKRVLADAMLLYVENQFRNGQFQNLKGIEKVLAFFGIDGIGFTKEHIADILSFYKKYSLGFLYSMSPPLWDGKLQGGREYNKVEYTRGLLTAAGASPDELTDDYIKRLWNAREILVKLHYEGDPSKLEAIASGVKSLADIPRLLED